MAVLAFLIALLLAVALRGLNHLHSLTLPGAGTLLLLVWTSVILAVALAEAQDRKRAHSPAEVARAVHVIRSCVQVKWDLSEARSPNANAVKLRLKFNRDGKLAEAPEVMNPETNASFIAVAQSAIRAILACEPYPFSPLSYEIWKDVILTFDARDMF